MHLVVHLKQSDELQVFQCGLNCRWPLGLATSFLKLMNILEPLTNFVSKLNDTWKVLSENAKFDLASASKLFEVMCDSSYDFS
jgi:hypothetical protein